MYEKIRFWYKHGIWTQAMVETAAAKGLITREQYQEIVGEAGTEAAEG